MSVAAAAMTTTAGTGTATGTAAATMTIAAVTMTNETEDVIVIVIVVAENARTLRSVGLRSRLGTRPASLAEAEVEVAMMTIAAVTMTTETENAIVIATVVAENARALRSVGPRSQLGTRPANLAEAEVTMLLPKSAPLPTKAPNPESAGVR